MTIEPRLEQAFDDCVTFFQREGFELNTSNKNEVSYKFLLRGMLPGTPTKFLTVSGEWKPETGLFVRATLYDDRNIDLSNPGKMVVTTNHYVAGFQGNITPYRIGSVLYDILHPTLPAKD